MTNDELLTAMRGVANKGAESPLTIGAICTEAADTIEALLGALDKLATEPGFGWAAQGFAADTAAYVRGKQRPPKGNAPQD